MQLIHDLGNGRAIANAREEWDEVRRVLARLTDLPAA